MEMEWVGYDQIERVALTRARCFGHGENDLQRMAEAGREDGRAVDGDFLLAQEGALDVGTATSLSMKMWIRGGAFSCQGVAWVGTIKTHRRRAGDQPGIASALMSQTLARARDRGDAITALMPFRVSFYEHFGYGVVERRSEWTLPLSTLPPGSFDSIRFFEPRDLPELMRCRQRVVERGQCDIERSPAGWDLLLRSARSGFVVVDRPDLEGPIHGWMRFSHVFENGRDVVRVRDRDNDSPAALLRQLHFLASLRDQYGAAVVVHAVDVPLNRLLKERQIPHRFVGHATASLRQFTRLQLRVLDHKKLLENISWPPQARGSAGVAIRECDGAPTRLQIDVDHGRANCKAGGDAVFECADIIWAAVVTGELPASQAVQLGLARSLSTEAVQLLDALAAGPKPFCDEYF